jgi:predicted lactoylglutathione lyase
MIFVNLPVAELAASKRFYETGGFPTTPILRRHGRLHGVE